MLRKLLVGFIMILLSSELVYGSRPMIQEDDIYSEPGIANEVRSNVNRSDLEKFYKTNVFNRYNRYVDKTNPKISEWRNEVNNQINRINSQSSSRVNCNNDCNNSLTMSGIIPKSKFTEKFKICTLEENNGKLKFAQKIVSPKKESYIGFLDCSRLRGQYGYYNSNNEFVILVEDDKECKTRNCVCRIF